MKKILVIDACVRRSESRTKKMMDRAVKTLGELHPDWSFEVLTLMDMDLKYWNTESLKRRDQLLAEKEYDAPIFALGRQFREADGVIIAAPFWDLSIPAILKVYIENISAEGITFTAEEDGLRGICKGEWMLFLTTRGGLYGGTDMEQGSTYMEAISRFFGIGNFSIVAADGMDAAEADCNAILNTALEKTEELCRRLS